LVVSASGQTTTASPSSSPTAATTTVAPTTVAPAVAVSTKAVFKLSQVSGGSLGDWANASVYNAQAFKDAVRNSLASTLGFASGDITIVAIYPCPTDSRCAARRRLATANVTSLGIETSIKTISAAAAAVKTQLSTASFGTSFATTLKNTVVIPGVTNPTITISAPVVTLPTAAPTTAAPAATKPLSAGVVILIILVVIVVLTISGFFIIRKVSDNNKADAGNIELGETEKA
jgi:hypothetical protein